MAREVLLPVVLQTAIERRYLDPAKAERVAVEAARRQLPVERALVVLGVLSVRRVERLQLHVRYRSLRKVDKTYVKIAIRSRLLGELDAEAACEEQRRRFEVERECVRVGAILVANGVLTVAQDQEVRAKVARVSTEIAASGSGSEATKLLAEESACSRSPAVMPSGPTYDTIDRAMGRVEAVKRAHQELSTSEQPEAVGPPRDSAAEFENAVRMLARRRVQSTTSSGGVIASGGHMAPDEGTSRTAGAPLDQPRRSGTRKSLRSA